MPSIVWPHQCSWLEPVSWEFANTGQFLCDSHRDYPLLPVSEAWSELCLVPVRGSVGSQFLVVEWELHMHKAQRTLGLCTTRYQLCEPPSRFSQPISSNTHPNQYSYRGLLFWSGTLRFSPLPSFSFPSSPFISILTFLKSIKTQRQNTSYAVVIVWGETGQKGEGEGEI